MECTLWKIQYVDKAETPFSIRLNKHRSDVTDQDAIPACRHFVWENQNFNTYAKFNLTETITNRIKSIKVIQDILRKREKLYSQLQSFTCT